MDQQVRRNTQSRLDAERCFAGHERFAKSHRRIMRGIGFVVAVSIMRASQAFQWQFRGMWSGITEETMFSDHAAAQLCVRLSLMQIALC